MIKYFFNFEFKIIVLLQPEPSKYDSFLSFNTNIHPINIVNNIMPLLRILHIFCTLP